MCLFSKAFGKRIQKPHLWNFGCKESFLQKIGDWGSLRTQEQKSFNHRLKETWEQNWSPLNWQTPIRTCNWEEMEIRSGKISRILKKIDQLSE